MRLHWIRVSGCVGAVALLLGCTSADDEASPSVEAPVSTAVAAESDPLQRQIIADEKVGVAEMERALRAVESCVEAEGFDAELQYDGGDGYGFDVYGPADKSGGAAQVLQACESRFLSAIEEQFVEQHGPSDAEIAAEHDEIRRCLQDMGYDVDGLDIVEMGAIADVWDVVACDPDMRAEQPAPDI